MKSARALKAEIAILEELHSISLAVKEITDAAPHLSADKHAQIQAGLNIMLRGMELVASNVGDK